MRRGKGVLTYHQLKMVHEMDVAEKEALRKQVAKLKADYRALSIAYNKARKDAETLDAVPKLREALGVAGAINSAIGRPY